MVLPTLQELVGFPFATVATTAKSGDTSPSLSDLYFFLETSRGLKYGSKYIWVTENFSHQCRFPSAQRFLPSSGTRFSRSFKYLTQFLSASCDATGSRRRCVVRHSSRGVWMPAIGSPLHEDLQCQLRERSAGLAISLCVCLATASIHQPTGETQAHVCQPLCSSPASLSWAGSPAVHL